MAAGGHRRNTLVFLGFLAAAGIGHVIEKMPNLALGTLFFCVDHLIYTGLLIFWAQSIRARLLPSREKEYVLGAVSLMLLFLFLRACRYRLLDEFELGKRLCWYGFYLPITIVPTLFLMCSIRFRRDVKQGMDERLLLIPAGMIALGILTNELHYGAFIPKAGMVQTFNKNGTYTHGPLLYAAYGWGGLMMSLGMLNLLRISMRRRFQGRQLMPFLFLALIPVMNTLRNQLDDHGFVPPYQLPEILIFCALGLLESCIRLRLIPHNEDYGSIFAQLRYPAMITDARLRPVYRTALAIDADPGQLRMAIEGPVNLGGDIRLGGTRIRAGAAFHTADEGELRRLNEELRDTNETLALENELIQRERELIAEKEGIEASNALYTRAAREVYPAQRRIAEILEGAEPDTPGFRPAIVEALILTAYVKRKANFILLSAERQTVTAEEIASAMRESAHYFGYRGIQMTVAVYTEKNMESGSAMAVYDCFEAAAEALAERTRSVWVRLDDRTLLIQADGDEAPPIAGTPLAAECQAEDGQVSIRFRIGGEAP